MWIAEHLLDEGFEVEILEQNDQPGGLMETIRRDGFIFDLGPHILLAPGLDHYRRLLGDHLLSVRGFYGFGYQGKQIPSPLSPGNLLRTLGPHRMIPFAASMTWQRMPLARPRPPWTNVEELLTARFGRSVYEAFFCSYIPKVTGIPASEVSVDWFLERHRFYKEHSLGVESLKKLRHSLVNIFSREGRDTAKGLELYYPSGGAQMLTDTLYSNILARGACVRLGARITGIRLHNRRVGSVQYEIEGEDSCNAEGDVFVNTLPLTHLPRLFGGSLGMGAGNAAGKLGWRHLRLFFVLVDRERVSDKIQVYFTEDRYPFKRIYEPKSLIPTQGSVEKTALCVEVCCSEGDKGPELEEKPLLQTVLAGICEFYKLPRESVHFLFSRKVPYAYAVYRVGYEESLRQIAAALFPIDNFVSYGRQGSYRYNHLVDRIMDASLSVLEYLRHENGSKNHWVGEPCPKADFF